MINLKEKQEELDQKKYLCSLTARTDMSGKMEVCQDCLFKNDKCQCELPHEIRKDYHVCARQFYKIKEEKKNEHLAVEHGKTRKRSNGKS